MNVYNRNHVLVLILGLMCSSTGYAEERKYVELIFVDPTTQEIGFGKNHANVYLPLDLKDLLKKNFKNYSLPVSSDYQLDWVGNYKERPVPFIAFGDFNYDNRQDIAVLLIEKTRDNFWKLVVFHRSKNSYVPTVLTASPEEDRTSPQYGRDYGPIQRNSIFPENNCSNKRPCLGLLVYEAAGFEYIWKNGKYNEINISD